MDFADTVGSGDTLNSRDTKNLGDTLANKFPIGALPAQATLSALLPRSLTELAEILQIVKNCGGQLGNVQLGICGHGSKLHWRSMPQLLVSTCKLPPIIEHAPDDLTVTVSAGITFQQLQDHLAKSGQFLPIDAPYPDHCTIGGIISTGITGSLRHRYGGVRDMVLGIEFMRSDGIGAKAGGKVVKNVAGYDLMKLLTGAWGSLAIVTAATLRLYPLPAHRQYWLLNGRPEYLGNLLGQLWRSGLTPTTVDLFSGGSSGELLIQFTGIPVAVTAQGQQLCDLVKKQLEAIAIDQVAQPTRPPIYAQHPELLFCKIGILPNYAPELISQFSAYPIQIHAGSGIGFARLAPTVLGQFTEFCRLRRGYVQVLTNAPHPQSVQQTVPQSQLVSERIKHQFDRSRIFPNL